MATFCIDKNKPEILNLLLSRIDYFLSQTSPNNSEMLLNQAIRLNHKGCVKILLEHKALKKNVYNEKPIFQSIQSGNYEIFQLLLEECVDDINQQDDQGHTLLHKASIIGNVEAVTLLLKYGADYQQMDIEGKTALGRVKQKKKDSFSYKEENFYYKEKNYKKKNK